RPVRMLVWDGSVTTLWAWASVYTRPAAARRSSSGVCERGLPAKWGASARSVSMVTRMISAPRAVAGVTDAGAGAGLGAAASLDARRAASPISRAIRRAPARRAASDGSEGRRMNSPAVRPAGRGLERLQELPGVRGLRVVRIELQQLLEVRLGVGVL